MRVEIDPSYTQAYRHAGGLSTQAARFNLQWRTSAAAALGCESGAFFPITPEELRIGMTVFRHTVYKPDDTGPAISCPNVSHRTAAIALLHTRLAGRSLVYGIVLKFSDVCRTGA